MTPPSTSLASLIRALDGARVPIWLDGDRIAFGGPLGDDLRAGIIRFRVDVIELLALYGPALLPLFRDPGEPKTAAERALLAEAAERIAASRPLAEAAR